MAITPHDELPPDVLRTAFISHFQAELRKRLMEVAKREVEQAIVDATNSLKTNLDSHYDVYRDRLVMRLLIDGVEKEVK